MQLALYRGIYKELEELERTVVYVLADFTVEYLE
jgi:hypothetical protein